MGMKIGAQMYTLRSYTQNARDLAFCLQKVRAIGYEEVQISGAGPIPPETIRALCDENGLSIVLTHTDPGRILNDTDLVLREHDILGCPYIGIGSLPERYRTRAWISHFAADFREPAKKIAAAGKLLMYHNHHFEFEKFGESRLIEILADAFPAGEMGFTLDTYWVQAAGADPVRWIDLLKDRIPCVHLKDMDVRGGRPVMAPVMEGNMNFEAILAKLSALGSTKHLLVEQDECLESPFDCLEKSLINLKRLGY